MSLNSASTARKLRSSSHGVRQKLLLRPRRARFKNRQTKGFFNDLNCLISQISCVNSLQASNPASLMKTINCSFNTLGKMPIPRRPLFPGSRKYVYLNEDVLDYFRAQPSSNFIDEEFLSS